MQSLAMNTYSRPWRSCSITGRITPEPLDGRGGVALRRQGPTPRAVRVGRECALLSVGL
jgi:hypothetical protein